MTNTRYTTDTVGYFLDGPLKGQLLALGPLTMSARDQSVVVASPQTFTWDYNFNGRDETLPLVEYLYYFPVGEGPMGELVYAMDRGTDTDRDLL